MEATQENIKKYTFGGSEGRLILYGANMYETFVYKNRRLPPTSVCRVTLETGTLENTRIGFTRFRSRHYDGSLSIHDSRCVIMDYASTNREIVDYHLGKPSLNISIYTYRVSLLSCST